MFDEKHSEADLTEPTGAAAIPTFEERLDACSLAFRQWEISWHHTDQQLYRAIGSLYELTMSLGNDMAALAAATRARGIQATKASTIYTLTARLVFADDRQKASKYAGVVRFLQSRRVATDPDIVAGYIRSEGGIEACLRTFRREQRPDLPVVSPAVQRVSRRARACLKAYTGFQVPDGLHLEDVGGRYFLLIGVRDEDGRTRLINQAVDDLPLIDRAIRQLAKGIAGAPLEHVRCGKQHRACSSPLFDRVVHGSGESACADRALAETIPGEERARP